MQRTAQFSKCRVWRYSLIRVWDESKKLAVFICLNPSTADETKDDPTVRRCINYSKAWGYGGFVMLNLFAFRATDPTDMKSFRSPIGPGNDEVLKDWAKDPRVGIIVAGWGAHGAYMDREKDVMELLKDHEINCLVTIKANHPGHPLYLKKDLEPRRYHYGKDIKDS